MHAIAFPRIRALERPPNVVDVTRTRADSVFLRGVLVEVRVRPMTSRFCLNLSAALIDGFRQFLLRIQAESEKTHTENAIFCWFNDTKLGFIKLIVYKAIEKYHITSSCFCMAHPL